MSRGVKEVARAAAMKRFATIALSLCVIGAADLIGAAQASAADRVGTGRSLGPCTSIFSASGRYEAAMQCDGNLVVYAPGHVPIWSSRTGAGGSNLEIQGDGNLVIYRPGHVPVWATGTGGGNVFLIMQNDANLVLYSGSGQPLWASLASYEYAISWFYNHQGATNYEGLCELAVENAFGTSGRYTTAISNWNSRDHNFPYLSAPRGTLVFYNTSSAGHVALSIGNGYVISSSAGGHIGVVPSSYFQNPLGWGHSPW
jgi:hypothetical protein